MVNTKKSLVRIVVKFLLFLILATTIAFCAFYASRFSSIASIERLTDYTDGFNLYSMDVNYSYDLDRIIACEVTDSTSYVNAVIKESLPLLPVRISAPEYGCSAFTMPTKDGSVLMGRNYDFKLDTSAMLIRCHPKDGYSSISFAALDNIGVNDATSFKAKIACLTAPFAILDGVNEKGVSMAVLTLNSPPTFQDTGKDNIVSSLAIRLVLDRAATTDEAVELLRQYDMIAIAGRDYHYYITDASGHGVIVEYDCDSPTRDMVVSETPAVTNFFFCHKDRAYTDADDGTFSKGMNRYDIIMSVLEENAGEYSRDTAWEALVGTSQEPNPEDVTSNTQWSIVFDDTNLTAEIVIRRNWADRFMFYLTEH